MARADEHPTLLSRFRGCLLGGAVGDALGAPVEFSSRAQIQAAYGETGVRELGKAYGVEGAITDDTQMTLFTIDGLIRAQRSGEHPCWPIRRAYERWLMTQRASSTTSGAVAPKHQGWLYQDRRLHASRAPGTTCIQALTCPPADARAQAHNDSKGCGGVMRIAPVGLVASDPFELGCLVAGITHGHILGRQAAGAMALTISALVQGQSLPQAVNALLGNVELDEELDSLVRKAVRLAQTEVSSVDAIEELGEGWVAEEAFAIGLFCALRGPNFEEALSAAVSHSGDSDSTGSIAGQLLGTAGGESVIPARWLDRLELRDVIERAAQDLYDAFAAVPGTDSSVADWDDRYPKA